MKGLHYEVAVKDTQVQAKEQQEPSCHQPWQDHSCSLSAEQALVLLYEDIQGQKRWLSAVLWSYEAAPVFLQ